MEINASHKASCWRNVEQFSKVKGMLFDESSTLQEKKEALRELQSWKIRRSQDTPLGVLCTIALLDAYVQDREGNITNPFTLCTLYGSCLTKFLNYASSFKMNRKSMYGSAHHLGLDSFLIDLRHLCAHGGQIPNLEVFQNSHRMCMKWIKEYYWDREVNNIEDADIKSIRFDSEMEAKLDELFSFYDLFAELVHKKFRTCEELEKTNEVSQSKLSSLKEYMEEKNLKNFRQAFKYSINLLTRVIESKNMRLNPNTFFHAMITKCVCFMNAAEYSLKYDAQNIDQMSDDDEEEVHITPIKRPKHANEKSYINLHQDLIFQIAKNDYLKIFLDSLFEVFLNRGEPQKRRESARFWIMILLKSFQFYGKYCKFKNASVMEKTKITQEIKNIYQYQLDADLKFVFVFVGTQMLPTSLKYSQDFVVQLVQNTDEIDDLEVCVSLLPLIYPPLSQPQIDSMKELIAISTNKERKGGKSLGDDAKVYTVHDLVVNYSKSYEHNNVDAIWQKSEADIEWNRLPIGYEFKV